MSFRFQFDCWSLCARWQWPAVWCFLLFVVCPFVAFVPALSFNVDIPRQKSNSLELSIGQPNYPGSESRRKQKRHKNKTKRYFHENWITKYLFEISAIRNGEKERNWIDWQMVEWWIIDSLWSSARAFRSGVCQCSASVAELFCVFAVVFFLFAVSDFSCARFKQTIWSIVLTDLFRVCLCLVFFFVFFFFIC